MIIDIHGHYTTEPQALLAFRDKQLAGLADPMRKPATNELGITDEQLVKSVEPQLKLQKERAATSPFSRRAPPAWRIMSAPRRPASNGRACRTT